MQISNETKGRIFGVYVDSMTTLRSATTQANLPVTLNRIKHMEEFDLFGNISILLTPLHLISDEDSIEVYKILKPNTEPEAVIKFHESTVKQLFKNTLYTVIASCQVIDYLRSKSYALPYLNYSVSDMVSAGIIKLREG